MRWGVRAFLFLGLLSIYSIAYSQNQKVDAYNYFKPATYGNASLSPDGRKLVFVRSEHEKYCLDFKGRMVETDKAQCKEKRKEFRTKQAIIVFDLETREPLRVMPLPVNVLVSWADWANNDRVLTGLLYPTTIGKSKKKMALGGTRTFSIDVGQGNGAFVQMFGNQEKLLRANVNISRIVNMVGSDPDHVVMSAQHNFRNGLWKVNINTGNATSIVNGNTQTLRWFTDHNGLPLLRFDCETSKCKRIKVYTVQGEGSTKWEKIKTFNVKPDESQEDYSFWPIAPSLNPRQFYVLSDEDSDDRRSLKLYDLDTRAYVKTVFEHPEFDVAGAIIDRQTGGYAGAWFYDDRLSLALTDPRIQTHYDKLDSLFDGEQNVDIIGYSPGDDHLLAYTESPNHPGAYYMYDFSKGAVFELFKSKPDIGDKTSGSLITKTDVLKIPMRDGVIITGYHTYNPKTPLSTQPLIVVPHGGPELRDTFSYDAGNAYLAAQGYQILQVNFRGSGGYGKAFAEAGYGEWGGLMQDDLTDAVKYVHGKGAASPANTCIVGYSYGGYAALQAAAATPDLFACAASGGGVADLMVDLRDTKINFGKKSQTYEYWLKSMGDPKKDKEKLRAVSPVHNAGKIKVPVFIAHGENDMIVKYHQATDMKRELKKAGNPPEFIKLEDSGHSNWSLEAKILYHEALAAFLAKHLK